MKKCVPFTMTCVISQSWFSITNWYPGLFVILMNDCYCVFYLGIYLYLYHLVQGKIKKYKQNIAVINSLSPNGTQSPNGTKPFFKWLQKTTYPKKSGNLSKKRVYIYASLWWGGVGGVEWSESKFSDHSPTIVGCLRIVGELINYIISSFILSIFKL